MDGLSELFIISARMTHCRENTVNIFPSIIDINTVTLKQLLGPPGDFNTERPSLRGQLMKIKSIITILLLLQIVAFRSDYKSHGEFNYYDLTHLKTAEPPRELEMVKLDNLSSGTSIISRGLLFTYSNRDARSVCIAGNFSQWAPRRMTRNNHGIWYFFLEEYGLGDRIEYKYQVGGIWTPDPLNSLRRDDGIGSYVSLASPAYSREGKNVTYKIIGPGTVQFRIYMPGARMISLVGDFNNWNPENDLLEKGNDGIWRLVKRITPGTYRYKYIVDGTWMPDTYNSSTASDDTGEICSLISVNKK